jgi:hypothetical protein
MNRNDLRGDWGNQIATLRAVAEATGGLHEAQVLQLKHWGAVSFHHLGKGGWDCVVDLEGRVINYRLRPGSRHPRNIAYLIASLDRSVHWLLGDEWALHVTEGAKILYQGERLVTSTEKVNEQRQARVKGRGTGAGGIAT